MDQVAQFVAVLFHLRDNVIDLAAVVRFEPAAAGVAEELFGEAADDKILASEERLFELGDVVDLLAVRERR